MEKVLEKSYRILAALSESKEPKGITELSRQLSLVKSNVHRLVTSLVELGLVQQAPQNEKYFLTLKLWQLGRTALNQLDVRKTAFPYMHELVNRFGEDVYLSVIIDTYVVYVDHVPCDHVVRASLGGGHEAYCSSTGKAILAWSPDALLQRIMSGATAFTETTITDIETMREELNKSRERGFALNFGEWSRSVHGVAAPVFDYSGLPVAALGISGPANRLPLARLEELGKHLDALGRKISSELGYLPVVQPEGMRHTG